MSAAYKTVTASDAITECPSELCSVTLYDADSAAVAQISDGDGGSVVLDIAVPAANTTVVVMFPVPVMCAHGIKATISGTTPSLSVSYL